MRNYASAMTNLHQVESLLYRYLSTLECLLQEKANSPAAAEARKVYEEQTSLIPATSGSEARN